MGGAQNLALSRLPQVWPCPIICLRKLGTELRMSRKTTGVSEPIRARGGSREYSSVLNNGQLLSLLFSRDYSQLGL